jgi:hypothetical protein
MKQDPKDIKGHFENIYELLKRHETRLKEMNFKDNFNKLFKRKMSFLTQKNNFRGMHLALCVDTRDPLKQNRVKWFSPVIHTGLKYSQKALYTGQPGESQATKVDDLDWAWPISSMGGFDDCGLNWVPPPGSMLCLTFLHDDPQMVFYIGTTWYRIKVQYSMITGIPMCLNIIKYGKVIVVATWLGQMMNRKFSHPTIQIIIKAMT